MERSISVIVMAYNEASSLESVVREIDSTLQRLAMPYEIVIVDDGSCDGTETIADRLARAICGVTVVHHKSNQGLGRVYRTGFAQARKEWVTFFPADGQYPARIIEKFAPFMAGADLVLGYLPERNTSLLSATLSGMEKILYRILYGPMPRFQGVLLFKRILLEELELKSTGRGWAILMELIIRASRGGYKVVSIPTELRPRLTGRSKVNNLPTIWVNLKQVIELRRYL